MLKLPEGTVPSIQVKFRLIRRRAKQLSADITRELLVKQVASSD
jgi:hypothetical protein